MLSKGKETPRFLIISSLKKMRNDFIHTSVKSPQSKEGVKLGLEFFKGKDRIDPLLLKCHARCTAL